MPFDSYADLQLTILNWLARPGDPIVGAAVPDMIVLFEEEARDRLKTRFNETLTTLFATIGSPVITLPSDYFQARELKIPGAPQWIGTGNIAGQTLSVDILQAGTVVPNTLIWGTGISDNGVVITGNGTGTGGTGTYTISAPLTVSETTISGTNTNLPELVLQYVTPEQMDTFADLSFQAVPERYTIDGMSILLDPIPDANYTILMDYMQGLPALTATNTSNWLLANYPSTYLFGSLLMAEAFIGRDERIPLWQQAKEASFQRIFLEDHQARFPGGSLQIKTDT